MIAPTSSQTVAPLPLGAGAMGATGGADGRVDNGGVAAGGALVGVGVAAGALLAGGGVAGVGFGAAPPAAGGGAFHCDGGTMTVAPRSAADCLRSAACADIGAPHSGQNAFCSGTDAPHLEHFAIHEFSAPSVNE